MSTHIFFWVKISWFFSNISNGVVVFVIVILLAILAGKRYFEILFTKFWSHGFGGKCNSEILQLWGKKYHFAIFLQKLRFHSFGGKNHYDIFWFWKENTILQFFSYQYCDFAVFVGKCDYEILQFQQKNVILRFLVLNLLFHMTKINL